MVENRKQGGNTVKKKDMVRLLSLVLVVALVVGLVAAVVPMLVG